MGRRAIRDAMRGAKPEPSERIRVAVIGCGAVSEVLHVPILTCHEDAKLVVLVDRDVERARRIGRRYGVERVLEDATQLSKDECDAAVVATPPYHHALCAIDLVQRGMHVLVEKPMATTYNDAERMVQVAEEGGKVLAVGFNRRLLPSMRLLKALVESEWLGRPTRVEAVSGDFYAWSSATLGTMRKDLAGGGVLIDLGYHLIDMVQEIFGSPGELLEYRDNALGGIETDCLARLRLLHRGTSVDGRLELSRTRKLGSYVRVECEGGTLEYRLSDRYRLWVAPRGLEVRDSLVDAVAPVTFQASWAGSVEAPWEDTARIEYDDWFAAIRARREPRLSGRSALPTARLVEECYRVREPLAEPWDELGAGQRGVAVTGGSPRRRVLITGATGFIGCRVAEILTLREGWDVRALVHQAGNASRLARLPVEMVQGELQLPADARRLVTGCDAVVHCAKGTDWGERRRIFDVNVGGTRTLAEAALEAGVRRFVHISTIAVHGRHVSDLLDESTPIRPDPGEWYSESKAEAEQAIQGVVQRGLSAVILRPACVYGPFSRNFVIQPIEALAEGRLRLVGAAHGPANTVYVDDVVDVIVRSLQAADDLVRGEVFVVGDGSEASWLEFYGQFAKELHLTGPATLSYEERRAFDDAAEEESLLSPVAWLKGLGAIARSAELRTLGKKVLYTDPIGRPARWVLKQVPGVAQRLRSRGAPAPAEARREQTRQQHFTIEVSAKPFLVGIGKARRVLGYVPGARDRAMARTIEWTQYAGVVREGRR